MKRILPSILAVVVVVGLAIFLFGSSAESPATDSTQNDSATTTRGTQLDPEVPSGEYDVSQFGSRIGWTARKSLVAGYEDEGFIPVDSGMITVSEDDQLTANVVFDVASIEAGSVSNENADPGRLTKHLRSDDFLAVEKYGTSTLTVTDTEPIASTTKEIDYRVTADLTLKGTTKTITFPAEIGMDEETLEVLANVTIDRTRWGIRYGSDSFFDNLGDNVIDDTVDISVYLLAEPTNS